MASIINATTSSGVAVSGDTSGVLQLATNGGTTAVTIDTSQNVGIGTTSIPANTKLLVNGGRANFVANSDAFAIGVGYASAGAYYIGANSANNAMLFSNSGGSEVMRLDSSGNVGIGTASPTNYTNQRTLAINGTTYGRLDLMAGGTVYGSLYGGTSGPTLASSGALPVQFETNGAERMRVASDGTLCVGTTSAVSGNATGISVKTTTGGFPTINQWNSATSGNRYYNYFGTGSTFTNTGAIYSSDGTSTSYTSVSDYRLKENIAPMTGALDKVAQLKPCTYTWKQTGTNGQGFIAHELQAVVPECVGGEKDAVDAEGNPKYQDVDVSFLVATLTAAIQEQQALITTLQTQVAALTAKVGN